MGLATLLTRAWSRGQSRIDATQPARTDAAGPAETVEGGTGEGSTVENSTVEGSAVDGSTTDGAADDGVTDGPEQRVRCRNCGRYYDPAPAACPHCGSGNKLRDGPPPLGSR